MNDSLEKLLCCFCMLHVQILSQITVVMMSFLTTMLETIEAWFSNWKLKDWFWVNESMKKLRLPIYGFAFRSPLSWSVHTIQWYAYKSHIISLIIFFHIFISIKQNSTFQSVHLLLNIIKILTRYCVSFIKSINGYLTLLVCQS